MDDKTLSDLDTLPLIGSAERPDVPWWVPRGSDDRRDVTLSLPAGLVEMLDDAQQKLGVAASDLVARHVEVGLRRALERRQQSLDWLDDHERIKGWMPDGTPILKTGE